MKEEWLTGRTAVRLQQRLFRRPLLVLQVEVSRHKYEGPQWGPWTSFWDHEYRDATIMDLVELNRMEKKDA